MLLVAFLVLGCGPAVATPVTTPDAALDATLDWCRDHPEALDLIVVRQTMDLETDQVDIVGAMIEEWDASDGDSQFDSAETVYGYLLALKGPPAEGLEAMRRYTPDAYSMLCEIAYRRR